MRDFQRWSRIGRARFLRNSSYLLRPLECSRWELEESATPALLKFALFGELDHRWACGLVRLAERSCRVDVFRPLDVPSRPLPRDNGTHWFEPGSLNSHLDAPSVSHRVSSINSKEIDISWNSIDLQKSSFNLRQGALPSSLFCARCFPITRIVHLYLSPTGVTEAVWVHRKGVATRMAAQGLFLDFKSSATL